MKEWLTVVAADEETWPALARETPDFVGSGRRS
jgi:hypothetical protein